jgi:predicted transcriptional regulator
LQDIPKFTQNGIFGLKKCHLATLVKQEMMALTRAVVAGVDSTGQIARTISCCQF